MDAQNHQATTSVFTRTSAWVAERVGEGMIHIRQANNHLEDAVVIPSIIAMCSLVVILGPRAVTAQIPVGYAGYDSAQITLRLSELSKPTENIPQTEPLLNRELEKLDSETISATQVIAQSQRDYKIKIDQVDKAKLETQTAIKKLVSLDCSAKSSDFEAASRSFDRSQAVGYTMINDYGLKDVVDITPFYTPAPISAFFDGKLSAVSACSQFKELYDAKGQGELSAAFDKIRSWFEDATRANVELRDKATQLLTALKQRRAAVLEKLASSTPQQEISSRLSMIVLILGGFSVAAILAVRLFASDIQMEWVASGQLIQFVTVSILLGVILILGLSNILKENTLGTLLGGVAGYVLAQGVGKSAAREASRGRGRDGDGASGAAV